ncbi:MAG: hypothetical protein COB04_16090 [Gammaproteobacteria bacterium]|nr:MAG: hypothetical protein COB04_16090 [Gammaproteobacteria bacterium]
MQNQVNSGDRTTWINGTGAKVLSGAVVIVGSQACIAAGDIEDGAEGELYSDGAVYISPKLQADVVTQGELLTFEIANSNWRNSSYTAITGDIVGAGVAVADAGGSADDVRVRIGNVGAITA